MQFKHTQLDNGLDLIAEVNPAAASMALGFFARAGSRDEAPPLAGVSHFLEHMMFKGTARRSAFDINREFDELGAMYNAFTSEENTVYWAAVLPEYQTRALDLLGDMLRPSLRAEDFQTEKSVILEEIALYQDKPDFRLYEKLMAAHFGTHPLGRSILGTNESITALTREQMAEYFRGRYSPGNVTVVAAGHLDWDALAEKTTEMCGGWDQAPAERSTPEAPGTLAAEAVTDAKLQRQHLGMMSPGPSAQDEDRYAGHLLATLLGDHTGSRLFYALIEPAIAEEADCTYRPFDRAGALYTFLCTDPDRAEQALAIVRREYARFAADGPSDEELAAAKNKTASAATLEGELPMGRLSALGGDWVYRRSYRPLAEHIERILAVTSRQVLDVARRYDITKATVLALGPRETLG